MSTLSDEMMLCFREFAKTATVPILEAVNGGIDQVATGTLFKVADRCLLVTARHIFDDSDPSSFCIPANPDRDPDPQTWGAITLSKPDQEEIDIAVVELQEPRTIARLKQGWRILTLNDVALASTDGEFALCGYPSGAGVRIQQDLIGSTLLAFHTVRIPPPDSATQPVQPDLDLFFQYTRKAESAGIIVDTPHLRGTSGCSIWECREPQSGELWAAEKAFKIVGVQASMRSDYSYFRAKSWSYVLELVSKIDPVMEAAIDTFRASL